MLKTVFYYQLNHKSKTRMTQEEKELSTYIGNRVKMLCLSHGISHFNLARQGNLSRSTVKRLVDGAGGNTRYKTIEKICSVFGISIGVFWNEYQVKDTYRK